jgi:hypothetical protein
MPKEKDPRLERAGVSGYNQPKRTPSHPTKSHVDYKDIDYAYYLLAISHYEQIVDEKKDLQSIIDAKKIFLY